MPKNWSKSLITNVGLFQAHAWKHPRIDKNGTGIAKKAVMDREAYFGKVPQKKIGVDRDDDLK